MANTTFNTTPQPTGIGLLKSNINTGTNQIGGILSSAYNAVRNFTGANDQPTPGTNYANPTRISTSTVPQSGLGAFNSTKTTSANGGSSTKPLSIPSVLVQQQALNKQGAGLVEDGIAGPKTEAAIAKYGTGSTSSSTSTGNTSNSSSQTDTNSADKYNIYTGALNSNYVDPNAPANTNYNSSNPATFPGLINRGATASGNAANTGATNYDTANTGLLNATAGNQQYQDNAANIANAAGQQISNIGQEGARGEAGYLTTGTSPVGEGNSAVLAQTTAAQQQAVSQGANMQLAGNAQGLTGQLQQEQGYNQASGNALTSQGKGITGLNSAAGNIAPVQVPYNNQYINPTTGQSVSGGTTNGTAMSSLPQAAQTAVQSYAQQVKSGAMTRADAESRLSAYGVAGTNALNEVLGSNFNTNASNASAGTTAVGQQIQTAADSTNKALDTLSSAFSALPGVETGGVPLTNSIAQWIGTQFGSSALQQYKTNLADARSQLIGVLNSSGGTPTGNEATANQYLPDNMTKAQFDANVGTAQNPGIVRKLITQKVSSFTGSGSQNGTSTGTSDGTSTSGFGWNG